MLALLWAIGSFMTASLILVAVHEYGHFLVARCCGVKVLRYSIGFGPPLFSWHDRKQTEYIIAAIPLGGYVTMLDERNQPVASAELPYTFNRKPFLVRVAIVLAGPLFNLLLAALAYWLVFCIGITQVVPVIGQVTPGSVAASAGLGPREEIVAIANQATLSWSDVQLKILTQLGKSEHLPITTKKIEGGAEATVHLDLSNWHFEGEPNALLGSLGIEPEFPSIVIAQVMPATPAAAAGLQPGDRIVQFNGETVTNGTQLIHQIAQYPGKAITLGIQREQHLLTLSITLDKDTQDEQLRGYLGIQIQPPFWPDALLRHHQSHPLQAVWPALLHTWEVFKVSWQLLGSMVTGEISMKALSGPIGIAQGAAYSASLGWSYFLNFLGLMSISLAVINILPIPLLDGGYLLYAFMEIIIRRPLSEQVQRLGMVIGLIFLLAVMGLAFYNDLSQW